MTTMHYENILYRILQMDSLHTVKKYVAEALGKDHLLDEDENYDEIDELDFEKDLYDEDYPLYDDELEQY